MRPITLATLSSVTTSPVIPLDYRASNPMATLNLIVTGTNTTTVQVTDDDVFAPGFNPLTANWIALPSPAAFTGATASQTGSFSVSAYTGLRLNMTAWTSGGATLKIISNSTLGV